MDEDLEKKKIRFRAILEVVGKPQDYVEKTLRKFIDKLKEDSNYMVLKEKVEDVKPQDKFFSTFAELEMVSKNFEALFGFCFDYMPSSIEIIKPEEFQLPSRQIADLLNDLQARNHKVDMVVKNLQAEAIFLKRNMQNLCRNTILLALTLRELPKDKLSNATGIPEKELDPYLEELLQEQKIKKEDDLFSLSR